MDQLSGGHESFRIPSVLKSQHSVVGSTRRWRIREWLRSVEREPRFLHGEYMELPRDHILLELAHKQAHVFLSDDLRPDLDSEHGSQFDSS